MDLQVVTIISLIVGGIAGWIVAKLLRRKGLGLLSFIVVGVIGGYLGYFLSHLFDTASGVDLYYHIAASSAVGGIVLVVLWRLLRS
jgi:uncharacterized membrane protein YeaQ/YmgE (transglycosylase-associated protein family)